MSKRLWVALALAATLSAAEPYRWKSVQIVGGGFVDGIVFHPSAKGVRYARTDMGGAYRWNERAGVWEPLLDWLPYEDLNLMGVESIALDPSDPNRLYLACGTYTSPQTPNGAILRSSDRGATFERANVPFKFGGNEDGRGNGERMAVDPHDGARLYLGTRYAGLWTSADRGATWTRVDSFPDVGEAPAVATMGQSAPARGSGIVFVVFDPRAKGVIYVGASLMGRENLFRSADGGKTWQAPAGQPTRYRPNHAVLASDGALYVSYGTAPGPSRMTDGAVWKLDTASGQWTDITPAKPDDSHPFGYGAVSVDAHDPRAVIASAFGADEILRSTDAGKTWRPVFAGGATFDYSRAPYVAATPIHWMLDVEIDPADPKHAMFVTGYGGWETFNLTDLDAGKPVRWSVMSSGIEETVPLEFVSPRQGAHLISGVGDYGGFTHWDLDKPAPEGASSNPIFNNTTGVAAAENKPEVIVRVGIASRHHAGSNLGYSLDGGKSWQPPAALPRPGARLGSISVSADAATWVWTPQGGPAYFTRDRGATWTKSEGLGYNMRVVADRVNPQKFYALALFSGKLFVSSDGAATFAERTLNLPDGAPQRGNRGDDRGGQDRLYAEPGQEGRLWLAAFHGLYRSADAGETFLRMDGVREIHAFGFGKDALYLVGVVEGVRGIFRSDDTARSWVRINDDRHQWGLILQISGDPKRYGRVYVGTHGRGLLYGDPAQ
jgi:photosystem II stability/assembly factor-like uncharacterized protein